jgi:hypothetical protein
MTMVVLGVTVGGYKPRGEMGVGVGMLVDVAVGRGVSVGRRVCVGRRVGVDVQVAVGAGVYVLVGVGESGGAVLPLFAAATDESGDAFCHKSLMIETSSKMATSASPTFNNSTIKAREFTAGVCGCE